MRFRIDDFLSVEGPSLDVDLANRRVTKFSRLTISQDGTTLAFEASPDVTNAPTGFSKLSTISWKKDDDVDKEIDGGIELRVNRTATIEFHWANPLTPSSAGLFFRLAVEKNKSKGQYVLRFLDSSPQQGHGFLLDTTGFERFFLGDPNILGAQLLSPAEWRVVWRNRMIAGASPLSIREGVLFKGEDSRLIANEPEGSGWNFGWRFVKGVDAFRPVAMVGYTGESFAVSPRALRIEEHDDLLPRPLRWHRDAVILCASVASAEERPTVWAVDWMDVPTFDTDARRRDQFSFRSFWQELARHWPLGLRALRSRNALTFVPTDITAPENAVAGTPWIFRFRCVQRDTGFSTKLATIGSAPQTPLLVELGLVLDTTGVPCIFESNADSLSGEKPLENIASVTNAGLAHLLHLRLTSSAFATNKQFLVGGMRLEARAFAGGSLKLEWAGVRTQLGQPPIAVDLDLTFSGGAPRPGTEDPERGFESENDLLERDRPLVIDLSPAVNIDTVIKVSEDANDERSRVLEVLVRNMTDDAPAGGADVVIIDPAPMLVARVQSDATSVKKDAILASYRDDGERPPGWELLTSTGDMTLVLPPQAIGEEMIKGNLQLGGVAVPDVTRPFDFRLSPPARLELDRTDVDTARAPAPWSLRRLLDRREGVVGLKLKRARFELLYGLRTRIEEAEGLRIAEQDAFVGRVPIAPALRDRFAVRDEKNSKFDEDEVLYARKAVRWIRSLFRRPAQLPVFRDFAKRERLVIREGAAFDFRETRQTANPFQIGIPASTDSQPPADFARKPLRGGADYPFESQNIYNAVLTNPQKGSEGQPQGHIAGLVFGTLGGTGSQHAAFDNGKSIIISETSQGRLSSLTLIRIGRIAMLWHAARHVIVYERTTRTAKRYQNDQPDAFEGLNALRKVKEYVEITQPRRAYPDFATGLEERPAAGPIVGCTFETIVIPVKSSWGHDIEEGWVIALRGPLEKDEEVFYPFPKIFLELARAEGKGSGAINHLVSDPTRLYFFTTTRPTLGADTDSWPAWPDVDFPLTQKPVAPKVRYLPGFSGANHQPDAAEHDFGQRRFTIDVDLPEEAANLMHGRAGRGLEARVRNVSLLRGGAKARVPSVVEREVGQRFAAHEATIADSLAELAQHFERLAERGGEALVGEVAGLREQARVLLAEAQKSGETVLTTVAANATVVTQHADTWAKQQARQLENAKANLERAQTSLEKQLKQDLLDAADRLGNGQDETIKNELRVNLAATSDAVCRQFLERAQSVPYLATELAGKLQFEFRRVQEDVARVFGEARETWNGHIDHLIVRLPSEAPDVLRQELISVVLDVRARIAAFGTSFGRLIKDRLGPLFGDIPGATGAVARLTDVIDTAVLSATQGIDETLDIIPPFEMIPPDATTLKKLLGDVVPDVAALFKSVETDLVDPLVTEAQDWAKKVQLQTDEILKHCNGITKDLLQAIDGGVADKLRELAGEVSQKWTGPYAKLIGDLRGQADTAFSIFDGKPLAQQLAGVVKRDELMKLLQTEVQDVIKGIGEKLDDPAKTVRHLADETKAEALRAATGLRRVGEDIEQAVANEMRGVVEGAKDAGLVLARALAEGPVTDTLRCTRDFVGYYYEQVSDSLDVTRAAAVFNDFGGAVLNGLSAQVPFDRIRDRIMAQLGNFDLNKLFPDFAGLKLEHLLGGVKIPTDDSGEYDWIRMRHGFDRARLTAWSEVVIDKQFEDAPELFTLPPVALSVVRPRFTATSRIEADANGVRAQRTQALLVADWTVTLNGQLIMSIEGGGLYFDNDGGFRFDFESNNLQVAPALQFVTDAMRELLPSDEGLTLTPILPGGISVELSVPLPDIGTGAFTLTGVTLYTHFDLLVAGGFEVRTGLWLSRPERPFGLAVLFLGGGGWFGVDVRYKPPQEFETRVSLGIAAGAFVALNFGVARGSAGVLFTVGLDFYRNWLQNGSQDLAISFGILVWGEFSILSIVSAYLRVVLRIEYRNGEMTGYGNVSVSIKICWCFTLRVNSAIRLPFKSSSSKSKRLQSASAQSATAMVPTVAPTVTVKPATVDQALGAYFGNLAL